MQKTENRLKRRFVLFIFMMCLLYPDIRAQVAAPYELATWKGFAQSAVSYTWDDNTAKQLSDALPLYDAYDFKATFFTIVSANPNWSGLKLAAGNGHEIASHTMTHTALNTLNDTLQDNEQKNSQSEINTRLPDYRCVTLAYPYCAAGNRSITNSYYISARGCNGQVENKTPADFLNVGSIICGTQGSVRTASDFNSIADNAFSKNGWAVFLLHGINNDGGFSPIDSAELRQHLSYIHTNADKFWVQTYGNVVRYIRERDVTAVQELANTDSLITFSITNTLDPAIYNFPLTVKRPLPENWIEFIVLQNGKKLVAKTTIENGKPYLIMNVLPNGGNVLIRNTGIIAGITQNSLVSAFTVYPNPFLSAGKIQYTLEKASVISLELLNESGEKIRNIVTGSSAAGQHEIDLDVSDLHGTVFYCALYVNGALFSKKLISVR